MVKKLKEILHAASKSHIAIRLQDRQARTIAIAACSLAFNALYALINMALGYLYESPWFAVIGGYHLVLGIARTIAVQRRHGNERRTEILCGALLIILGGIITQIVSVSIRESVSPHYPEIAAIAVAAYTFTRITVVSIQAARQRRNPSITLRIIRTLSWADTAAAVISLQRLMLASFSDEGTDWTMMNAHTGAAVCFFVFILGIRLLRGRKTPQHRSSHV